MAQHAAQHYTAQEKQALWRQVAQGRDALSCPRCGATCAVVRGEPRRDVSYVRDRVVVRCASCGGSASVESAGRQGRGVGADSLLRAGQSLAQATWLVLGTWLTQATWLALALTVGSTPVGAWAQSVAATEPCIEGEPCGGAPDPGPLVLELPVGARAVALGGAFWTAGDEAGAIFHHPSLIAGNGFGMSWQRFHDPSLIVDGVGFLTMSGSAEWMGGAVGGGLALMEYNTNGEEPWAWPRSVVDLGGNGNEAASAYVAAGGYSREIGGFTVGGAVKAVGLRVGTTSGVAGAVDVGASTELGPATVALTVQNLGPDLRMEFGGPTVPLARRVTLGAGAGRVPFGPLDVGGAARVTRTGRGEFVAGGGVEVAWWPILRRVFIARAGLVRMPDDIDGSFYELTFGGGFAGDRIRLDYAYQRHGRRQSEYPPLTVSHTFGLSFR